MCSGYELNLRQVIFNTVNCGTLLNIIPQNHSVVNLYGDYNIHVFQTVKSSLGCHHLMYFKHSTALIYAHLDPVFFQQVLQDCSIIGFAIAILQLIINQLIDSVTFL
jgi:hypothetical protein